MKKSHEYAISVDAEHKVDLSKFPTKPPESMKKDAARKELSTLGEELTHLQEMLYAAGTHSLLLVLQGMDTAGKDGAIRHVMKYSNPQGCRVHSFKVPSEQEQAHDFLWRVHKVAPPRGMIGVFNRSHYEDVVVVRVQNLAPKETWKARYDQINDFEKLLSQNNTIVVKCFLHVSKDEQEERLLEREQEVEKAWKLSVGDWQQRALWEDYQRAYAEALEKCSTQCAPWHVVPADKKWFRNVAVARVLVEALRPYENGWEEILATRSKEQLSQLQDYRART